MKREDVRDYATYELERAATGEYSGLIERLPKSVEGASVLDLGAGPGTWTRLFAEAGAATVVWQDLSTDFLAIAIEHLEGVDQAQFAIAEMSSLPFASSVFDIVFCRVSLHHAKSERRTIGEIARVLRPGGIAVIITNRVARVTRSMRRTWKKPLHYVTPIANAIAGRKIASAVWSIDRLLRARLLRSGLTIEEWDATAEESLLVIARRPPDGRSHRCAV